MTSLLLAKETFALIAAMIPIAGQLVAMLNRYIEQRSFSQKAKRLSKAIKNIQGNNPDWTMFDEANANLEAAFSKKNQLILLLMATVNEWVPETSRKQFLSNLAVATIGGTLVYADVPQIENVSGDSGFDKLLDPLLLSAMGCGFKGSSQHFSF